MGAGIIVSLINKYLMHFNWCGTVREDLCEDNDDDSTPSKSTAINSDAYPTHQCVTYVH